MKIVEGAPLVALPSSAHLLRPLLDLAERTPGFPIAAVAPVAELTFTPKPKAGELSVEEFRKLATVTPPEASTGIGVATLISRMASKFGPAIMPSRAMSV